MTEYINYSENAEFNLTEEAVLYYKKYAENRKYIVNIKTIKGVRAITHLESYKDIDIMNPSVLLGGER